MRIVAAVLLVIAACAPADNQTSDTNADTTPEAAGLQASDLTGTWTGATFPEGSDSVLARWTASSITGSTGLMVFEGSADTVRSRVTFDADSVIVESDPYVATTLPDRPQVRFRSIGRLRDGRLVGTTVLMLASPSDSVIRRSRFEATRAASPTP